MDFSNPLGITYRVVKEVTHDGKPARVVSGSTTFDTDPADLWDAVTNAERLPRWFLPISGDLKVSGRYQLEGHAGGEITRCDPPEAFDVSVGVRGQCQLGQRAFRGGPRGDSSDA